MSESEEELCKLDYAATKIQAWARGMEVRRACRVKKARRRQRRPEEKATPGLGRAHSSSRVAPFSISQETRNLISQVETELREILHEAEFFCQDLWLQTQEPEARDVLSALSADSRMATDDDSIEWQLSSEFAEMSAGTIPKGKHVMVSYCWKQKEQVKKLVAALRQLGLVVWRDEEGTIYAPRIENDTAAAMRRAIENSIAVIVCVSRDYYESGNCRLEATCAWDFRQRGQVEMLFVMLQEDFTTFSKDGRATVWLGFLIGQDPWYPLWSEGQIGDASQKIFERIGKLSQGDNGQVQALSQSHMALGWGATQVERCCR